MNRIRIENDNLIIEIDLKENVLTWDEEILPYFVQALNGLGYVVPNVEQWSIERG
jgi:hypothetical protein